MASVVGLRVGKAGGVEGVRAPLPLGPVLPVLHDHVEREASRAELLHRAHELVRRLVALAALPVAEGPARRQRGAPRQRAVAADHLVERRPAHEDVVDALGGSGPERDRRAALARGQPRERESALGVGALPLEAEGVAASGLEAQPGDVGRPQGRAPGVDDEAIVDPQLRLPDRVGHVQGVLAGAGDGEEARPARGEALRDDLRRQAHRRERGRRAAVGHGLGPGGRRDADPRRRRHRERLAQVAVGEEGGGEAPRLARLVHRRRRGQRGHVLGPAEAHVGRVVPEEPPAPGRDEEGNDDLAIVLPEVQVAAGEVEEAILVLAEAVERLALGALELLADHERRLAEDLHGGEGLPAARPLAQQRPPGLVLERHLAGAERHPRRQPRRAQDGRAGLLARLEVRSWPRRRSRRERPARAPGTRPARPRRGSRSPRAPGAARGAAAAFTTRPSSVGRQAPVSGEGPSSAR